MKGKKLWGFGMAAVMLASMFTGKISAEASGDKDVVTALLPPVSATYQDKINSYVEAFNKENPGIEIQVTTASWEDVTQKLDVQVNAGSPPDIAFIGSDGLSKYVDSGMAVDISKYADEEMMADFDQDILNYFKNGDGMYGFPAYCEVQCIGGNRQFLEEAGIDWKKVQEEGWSYDEFREAINSGVVKDGDDVSRYGFHRYTAPHTRPGTHTFHHRF